MNDSTSIATPAITNIIDVQTDGIAPYQRHQVNSR